MEPSELDAVIAKAVEKATEAGLKAGMEAAQKAVKTPVVVMGESEEDKLVKGKSFKSGAHYLSNVIKSTVNGITDEMALYQHAVKTIQGQSVTTSADGGYLVPTILSSEMLKTQLENEFAYQLCRKIPMATNNLSIPYLVDKDHSGGMVRNAIMHYIVGEGSTITKSKVEVNKLALTCYKVAALTYLTREIMEDSPISMEAIVKQAAPEQLAFAREGYLMTGTGTGMPTGAFAAANPALKTVTRDGATAVTAEDVLDMYSAMYTAGINKAVWVAGPRCIPSLAKMTLNSVPVYLPFNSGNTNSNLAMAPQGMLLGRPVYFSEHAAALGSDGDLNFIDFSQLIVGERGGISYDQSIHVEFLTDQTVLRWVTRYDSKSGWYGVLTDKQSTTHSPFVKLVT